MRFTVYERAEYYEKTENGLFPIGCRDFRGKGGYAKTERLRLEYFYARAEVEYFFRKHVGPTIATFCPGLTLAEKSLMIVFSGASG